MKRSLSLEKIGGGEAVSNERYICLPFDSCNCGDIPKRKYKTIFGSIFEQYSITIKPELYRTSSLSDLTNTSQFTVDFIKFRKQKTKRKALRTFYGSAGDNLTNNFSNLSEEPYMSWNLKGKKSKKKDMSETYASKFAEDFMTNFKRNIDQNSSGCDNTSSCSTESMMQKGASFPFKSTPSGNLKVQSNQVVFQSSVVGVLLADPTQAKVKVKFESKAGGEPDDDDSQYENYTEPHLQFGSQDTHSKDKRKSKRPSAKDHEKDLLSLGYGTAEPVDWMRVQLPKKPDLFQEFYRRVHNFINTDTVVRIDVNVFKCHRMVLQMYSAFFEMNPVKEIELPSASVSPESFQAIYEWMICSGQDSNKVLKRDNILELFCAAQYLSIKDLEDQCWSFIVNDNLFTEDTAFALFREAKARGMTPVMDIMVPRVMRFFLPLVASKDFLGLGPDEITTFLKSNYISVTSEIEVLMAGVRWLHGDLSARRRHVVDVMRCVRFGLISPWQLVDIKRNPDNGEILAIVNEADVQQMVDDGLAYVIIKYWYGNNSKNYYHWIDVLGLTEPAERNWIGEEKNHVTYKDFLKYLEQFMVPKEQMNQQMAMMQATRRTEDMPGSMRCLDSDQRRKIDFPLPATLKGLSGDKDKSFPTMSEFFDNRRKDSNFCSPPSRFPQAETDINLFKKRLDNDMKQADEQEKQYEQKQTLTQTYPRQKFQQLHLYTIEPDSSSEKHIHDPPEKDSEDNLNTITTTSSGTLDTSMEGKNLYGKSHEKRHSVAASYLASATAALASNKRETQSPSSPQYHRSEPAPGGSSGRPAPSRQQPADTSPGGKIITPQISLFDESKDSIAKHNMNKLSASIMGPSNKIYMGDGSLFNWDRETVLVFGGIDPHTPYGIGGNVGKDIFRFDPVTNVWDKVGDLPEPRHHHSVAFLRGRVYLVGGADPRDDDVRGKSVVVSTVWSFEPVTRSWYSEAGLAVPRKNFGLVVHRMALYAIGGQDRKGRVLRSVERFDPKSASWSEVRGMRVARMAVACAKYREYIWVAGGMTGEKKKPVCKIVECYNSNTNEWTEIHSLRFPRCFATLFAMNDKLYIIGGAGKITEKDKTASSVAVIDAWDWKSREWRHETEMSMPRHGHALAYLGTQLIIIGGVTTIYMRALNNVESYCCERGAWIRGVATLPSPMSGHGAVTLPPASLM